MNTHHTDLSPHSLAGLALRARKGTARRLGAVALGLSLATTVAACGDEDPKTASASQEKRESADQVEIQDPWVRATEGAEDTTMTAAFMVLDNTGTADVELVGAAAEVAGRTELHEMVMADGKSVMQKIEGGLEIRAGSGQLLQPGGNHVMLMDVAQPLAAGDEVTVVLEFSDGSEKSVTAPVKAFTEEEGHYHAPGTGEHTH
jgi:periplasmic copper chaperone A